MSRLDELTIALALFAVALLLFGMWQERGFRRDREAEEQERARLAALPPAE